MRVEAWFLVHWRPLLALWTVIFVSGGLATEFFAAVYKEKAQSALGLNQEKVFLEESNGIHYFGWLLSIAWPIVIPIGVVALFIVCVFKVFAWIFIGRMGKIARWYVHRGPKATETYRAPSHAKTYREVE